jgi:cytochrome b561
VETLTMQPYPSTSRAQKYTSIAMAFHWIIAALIVWGFALGWIMTDIPGFTPTKLRYFSWHKWIGVTVLGLAVLRLVWRALNRPPALPEGMHGWEKLAAHAGHIALYILMLAIPVSGYFYTCAAGVPVVYLGVLRLPMVVAPDHATAGVLKLIHIALNYALLAAVAGHVLAVIKHHLIDRVPVLSRMLPFGR